MHRLSYFYVSTIYHFEFYIVYVKGLRAENNVNMTRKAYFVDINKKAISKDMDLR